MEIKKLSHIAFESYSECNLKCKYCYNHWKRDESEIPFVYSHKKAKKTIQTLYKQTDVKQISFTGGEPLLNPYIEELILIAKQHNSKVSVISNGNGRANLDYTFLKDLNVDLIMFPIHSFSSQIHDTITTINGSWDKSFESILNALSLGIYVVPVIVLTTINAKDVKETLLFLKSIGLNRISVNRYNIGGAGISNNEIVLSHSELRKTFKIINETAKEQNLIISSNVCTPFCIIEPNDFSNISFGSCGNNQYNRPITLDINGNIRACNHSPIEAGNIYNQNIFEILESDYIKSWNTAKPDYCKTCLIFDRCFGGCKASSEQLGLSLNNPDPYLFI